MALARCILLVVGSLSVLRGGIVRGAHAEPPFTDLYGDPLPPGAVARLGTFRLRHVGAHVIFSKDGKQLTSCDWEGEIRIWNVATGKLVRRQWLTGKPRAKDQFGVSVLSPDGKIVAIRGEGIYLYDINAGKQKARITSTSNTHPYLPMKFSPDGKLLALQASGKDRKRIMDIWDVNAIRKHSTLAMPPNVKLSSVAFSEDGKRIAGIAETSDDSGRQGGRAVDLFLWDTSTGKLLRARKQLPRINPDSIAFSPDGQRLALGSRSEAVVRLLAADTLKEKSRLTAPTGGSKEYLTQLVFSPDGRRLAASWGTVRHHPMEASFTFDIPHDVLIWDLAEAKAPRHLPVCNEVPLVFAPDSQTLLCRNDCEMRLYDAASGQRLHDRPGHGRVGLALAVSLDGKIIASGDSDGILHLWDAATSEHLWKLEDRDLRITDCLFSADGKRVAAGNLGGPFFDFQAWETTNGKKLGRIFLHEGYACLYAAAVSTDGKRFMGVYTKEVNTPPGELIFWDMVSGNRLSRRPYKHTVHEGAGGTSCGFPAAFSPDGEQLSVWLGDRLGISGVLTGCLIVKLPKEATLPLDFSPDGRIVAAMIRPSKEDGPNSEGVELRSLIEAASGQEIVRLELKAPNKIAFAPDNRGLVVSDHKNLCIWDTVTGKRLHQMAWPDSISKSQDDGGYPYVPTAAALTGGRVVASMAEGDILVWDLHASARPPGKLERDVSRKELETLWSDLAGDARKAYRAIAQLITFPAQTVAFFQGNLRPAKKDKHLSKQLEDLDSDSFEKREAAMHELTRLYDRAEPLLREALENKPSLEMRRRIEAILSKPKWAPPQSLRVLRAINVLERIATPEARRLLENLAGGAASPETREAQAAVRRLNYRDASAKGRSTP